MRYARSRNRSFSRGQIEAHATELRACIIDNDIKSFDEIIRTIVASDDTGMFLAGVLNFNFLDEPNHVFTAMQAATVTAISTGDTEILRQLMELGADTSWDTSSYDCVDVRSLNNALPTFTAYPDYRYHGRAVSGDSVYESFERAIQSENMHEALYHQFLILDVIAEKNLDDILLEVLGISVPISIIQTIRDYTGEIEGLEALLSRPDARGWMRDLHNQSRVDSFAAQYNHQHPEAEAQGYGPGAMVVYKPK